MTDFKSVGSTDVCVKCHLSTGADPKTTPCTCDRFFFRELTPAEQAENEAFAVKFMGREIPGITGPVREVLLEQPYRTFLITGIAPPEPKRDVTPDGKWAHGSPENCGDPKCPDCEPKPRGGFEFL